MPARSVIKLGTTLERNLANYAVAAAAAGVGLLVVAQPTIAEVVYTPAHTKIALNQVIPVDLNKDGTVDFSVSNKTGYSTGFVDWDALKLVPNQDSNRGMGRLVRPPSAFALHAGDKISGRKTFPGGPEIMASRLYVGGAPSFTTGSGGCFFPWVNVKHRYLGLRFVTKNEVHYGWARLKVSCDPNFIVVNALLTGYAYETIPDKPIVAGDEGTGARSLGRLALGAGGKR
jgi:hypothetical protein